jgi:hypothetical protein
LRWQDHFERDDLIRRIRKLAREDLSMSQVAGKLGHGLNYNMVHGLATRAKPPILFGEKRAEVRRQKNGGVAKRPLTAPPAEFSRSDRNKVAIAVDAPKVSRIGFVILDEVDDFDGPTSVHFNDLRSAGGLQSGVPPRISDERCRFPLWPDRIGTQYRPQSFELMHCGKPVVPGTSWCHDCYAKVFFRPETKARPKRDRNGRKAGWEYGF